MVGKQKTKAALMVMTERSKRIEIIRKIESKSQECIVRELDKLERRLGTKKFKKIFKTITCDNGCENLLFPKELIFLNIQKNSSGSFSIG